MSHPGPSNPSRFLALLLRTALLCLALVMTTSPAAGAASQSYAFVDVNVLPMDPRGKELARRQTVVVRDGAIVAMGRAPKVRVPDDAVVIDGRKKFLLPGLWDMHAHGEDVAVVPDFEAGDLYNLYLANGITGVLDPWGFREIFSWRRALERGQAIGPRLHFTSPGVNEGNHSSADEVEASVRQWHQQGYEMIKTHSPIARDKFERLHEVARELGLPVVGHALRPGYPLHATLAQGQLMLAHIEEILSTTVNFQQPEGYEAELAAPLEALVASRTWVTSTLGTYRIIVQTVDPASFEALFRRPEMRFVPPFARQFWHDSNLYHRDGFLQDPRFWARLLDVKLYIARRLRDLGALDRLLLGSDSGIPLLVPGFGLHDELRLLVEAGLTPWEAILTGTYNPAAFLGLLAEAGTVEVGKRADLLLIDKSPLRKIDNLRRIAGVMVRGDWLPERQLEERLEAMARRWEE